MAKSTAANVPSELHDAAETLAMRLLHGTPSVAIHDVRCRPHERGFGAEEFCHSNQVVFPRHGAFLYEVRGEQLLADANHVLFLRWNESYRVAHPAGCGDDCTVFAFADEVLREAVASFDARASDRPDALFGFSHTLSEPRVFLLQEQLRRAASTPVPDPLALDEAAIALLSALLSSASRGRTSGPKPRRGSTSNAHREHAEHTKLVLAESATEALALEDIARAVHCSPFHLARLFRREVGIPIHRYQERLRLRRGLSHLAEGERNLSALALALGFSSHAHFSDVFRRAFGLTPSECRNTLDSASLRELGASLVL